MGEIQVPETGGSHQFLGQHGEEVVGQVQLGEERLTALQPLERVRHSLLEGATQPLVRGRHSLYRGGDTASSRVLPKTTRLKIKLVYSGYSIPFSA